MNKSLNFFILSLLILTSSAGFAKTATPARAKAAAKDQVRKIKKPTTEKKEEASAFSGSLILSKNNSLYDHKDGTFYDGVGYEIDLNYKFGFGSVTGRLSYDQNIRNNYEDQSDINDSSVTYSMNPFMFDVMSDTNMSLTPNLTAVIPLSKKTVKYDQLQTSIVLGVGLGFVPKQVSDTGNFSISFVLTAGRNIHRYEEDVNGVILNQYSSNQRVTLAYAIQSFSANISYTHKNRWSYQNTMREGFELSEELAYELSPAWVFGLGHTNSGAALKANGQDSNFTLVNEDDSVVYLYGAFNF